MDNNIIVHFKSYLSKRKKRKTSEDETDTNQKLLMLHDLYLKFISELLSLLTVSDSSLNILALHTLLLFELKLMESDSQEVAPHKNTILFWVVYYLVNSNNLTRRLVETLNMYMLKNKDVVFYILEDMKKILSNRHPDNQEKLSQFSTTQLKLNNPPHLEDMSKFLTNIYQILASIDMKTIEQSITIDVENMSDEEEEFNFDDDSDNENENEEPKDPKQLEKQSKLRKAFTYCWIEFMTFTLPLPIYKSTLEMLHDKILPFITKPILLFDFLSESYNLGGMISILSLEGLFTLIKNHNVEFPEFFEKLYNLFTPKIFYMKNRAKFFQLSYRFLRASRLSTQMICAFIKRLSRLSLSAPPHGAMIIVVMIYNLLKRHPAAKVLIHREIEPEKTKIENKKFPLLLNLAQKISSVDNDPYNFDEPNPIKSNAHESSLWELKGLLNHYIPIVSNIANAIFGPNSLKRAEFNVEEFANLSYKSLYQNEYKRQTKNNAINFEDPSSFFNPETFKIFESYK